jgi:hypothetical protein
VACEIDFAAQGWVTAILGRFLSLSELHSQAMQDVLAALEDETARHCGGK